MKDQSFLIKLYGHRFDAKASQQKNRIWKTLCLHFFQRFISKDDVVLDVGSGQGEFINNIQCKEKYALDANGENAGFLSSGVRFFQSQYNSFDFLQDDSVDFIFISNFSEHLKNKDELVDMFMEGRRVLRQHGKLAIMGPNIRYAYKEYWDFFDHHIPLSDKAIVEALSTLGFEMKVVIPRFLPYTTKSRLPKSPFLVWLYLKLPFFWRILGKQMLIIAAKP